MSAINRLCELCEEACMYGESAYNVVRPDIVYRIRVFPEKEVKRPSHRYYSEAIPRAFPVAGDRCYLIVLERWNEEEECLSRTALYAFYGENQCLDYGENLQGEDCYWDDRLEERVETILSFS